MQGISVEPHHIIIDEIQALANPVIRKKLLDSLEDDSGAAQIDGETLDTN